MFGSMVLEVVIGIIFIYWLMSIICSSITEMIARMLSLRSKNLEEGIRNLLNDGSDYPKEFGKEVYKHPLVSKLAPHKKGGKEKKPSYIPARIFALALFDVIFPEDYDQPKSITSLREMVTKIEDKEIKKTLLPLIDTAGDDLDKARRNIEIWFDDGMDRISGWYKRKTQIILLLVGFVVTILLNVDTLQIINSLANDNAYREMIVTAAVSSVEQQNAATENQSSADEAESSAGGAITSQLKTINEAQRLLQNIGLPIGWQERPKMGFRVVYKILGLFITILAVSQGAPFWFDVLNKVVNLRGTGKKPEKSTSTSFEGTSAAASQ